MALNKITVVRSGIYIVTLLGAEDIDITQIEGAIPRGFRIVIRLELQAQYKYLESIGKR